MTIIVNPIQRMQGRRPITELGADILIKGGKTVLPFRIHADTPPAVIGIAISPRVVTTAFDRVPYVIQARPRLAMSPAALGKFRSSFTLSASTTCGVARTQVLADNNGGFSTLT